MTTGWSAGFDGWGVGLGASVSGGDVTIDELKALYDTSRIVNVYNLSHLPAPVGGIITLADFTLYFIHTEIDVGSNIIEPGTGSSIVGDSPGPCALTNSGAAALVRGTCGIRNVQLICEDGTAYLADSPGTALLGNVVISGSDLAVDIQDCTNLIIDRVFSFGNDNSIRISGNCPNGQIQKVQGGNTASTNFTGIEIASSAIVGPLAITENQFTLSNSTHKAFSFSDSATYNDEVLVASNTLALSNDAVALEVGAGLITKSDPMFNFQANTDILDSVWVGSYGYDGNTSQDTLVLTQNLFFAVGAGNVLHPVPAASPDNERFSVVGSSAEGIELVYNGVKAISVIASFGATSERGVGASGTDNHIYYISKAANGSVVWDEILGTRGSVEANAQAVSVGRQAPTTLQPGDRLRVEVTNASAADNVRVRSLRLTVWRV